MTIASANVSIGSVSEASASLRVSAANRPGTRKATLEAVGASRAIDARMDIELMHHCADDQVATE
jgi:hypothetical protein